MKFFKTFYKSVAARTTFMVVLMLLIIMGIGSVWQMQHVTAVVGAEAQRQARAHRMLICWHLMSHLLVRCWKD